MELARRAASTFARDNAETQPLQEGLTDAVASSMSSNGFGAKNAMDVGDGSTATIKRSLQKEFAGSTEVSKTDGVEAEDSALTAPVESVAVDLEAPKTPTREASKAPLAEAELPQPPALEAETPVAKVQFPNPTSIFDDDELEPEMQYPDNQLGLEPSEGGSPMQVDKDKEIDIEDGMKQPLLHGGPSGQSGSAQDVLAVGVDQPSVEARRSVDDGVDVGKCSSTDAGADHSLDPVPAAAAAGAAVVPDEDEEPPVVARREQWGLKPLPKRRGRKPATPKPKDEPKPKRGPRAGGSRKTSHYITIDDIVPPTPAPPRAAAASSQAEPGEGPEDSNPETKKKEAKKEAVKKDKAKKDTVKEPKVKKDKEKKKDVQGKQEKAAKPAKKASKRKSSDAAPGDGDDAPRAEEDQKNNIVWVPVSKTAAPLVAGNLKWGPVQDHLVAAAGHAACAPPGNAAPADAAESVEPDGKKAKVVENDKLKTFARRWCPKLSPARERWFVVRDVFNQKIKPVVEGLGFSSYKVEDRRVFCHLLLSLSRIYVSYFLSNKISYVFCRRFNRTKVQMVVAT